MPTTLTLPTPRRFDLRAAVCSYGYFVLAPNRWDEPTRTLHRPLRDAAGRVVRAAVTHEARRGVSTIRCHRKVARAHHATLKQQVARMLHLNTDPRLFDRFQRLNPEARRWNFGRLLRSPTMFEDMVKTITGCNVAWTNTMQMNRLICEHVGRDGDFPTPAEIARCSPAKLKQACRVGYRAERIVRLAREVHQGRLDLAWFERPGRTSDELYEALRAIHGFGDYAASNVLQLLDRFDRLAVDSETIRHFRQRHGGSGDAPAVAAAAREHYQQYAPYQQLAYWFELWTAAYDGRL